MKILPILIPLVKEHHLSLSLANRAINVAKGGKEEEIDLLCQEIQKTFWNSFKAHFQTEETTVFAPLMSYDATLKPLCEQLKEEHQILKNVSATLVDHPEKLLEFGVLLKTHTRLEDRELFPQVKGLSDAQQQEILRQSEMHTKQV